jgi:ketosteroid isomerase-like protein
MDAEQHRLRDAYAAFNRRDIDAALALMHPNVDWPNALDGSRVHGREAVRAYWTLQWQALDPHVEPQGFATDDAGRALVEVQLTVRDKAGTVLDDRVVRHAYVLEGGLIRRMDILPPMPPD